jgi:hypothetical protein
LFLRECRGSTRFKFAAFASVICLEFKHPPFLSSLR